MSIDVRLVDIRKSAVAFLAVVHPDQNGTKITSKGTLPRQGFQPQNLHTKQPGMVWMNSQAERHAAALPCIFNSGVAHQCLHIAAPPCQGFGTPQQVSSTSPASQHARH
jgi:hypothetical protein